MAILRDFHFYNNEFLEILLFEQAIVAVLYLCRFSLPMSMIHVHPLNCDAKCWEIDA